MTVEYIKNYRLLEFETLLDDFECEIEETAGDKFQSAQDFNNIVVDIVGKSCMTLREILCLSSAGLPDGALALARNLYEQYIILAFFNQVRNEDNFRDYVEDYYADYDLQRLKILRWEAEHLCCDNMQIVSEYRNEINKIKNNVHCKDKGTYWWTGKKTLQGIVDFLMKQQQDKDFSKFMAFAHLCYKRACVSIHAGSLGNALRLGTSRDFIGVDNSAKVSGHELPLFLAANSFVLIAGIGGNVLNINWKTYVDQFNEMAVFYREKMKNDNIS